MTAFLSLLALCGAWLQTSRWLRLEPAPALVVAVAAMLGMLFVAGLLGALEASVWLLRFGGLVGLVAGAYPWIRGAKRTLPPLEVTLPMVLVAGFWALHHSATYFYYDEFAHWGIFLKDMLARGDFWGADTNAMHPRYLPGATLWQYFFCQGLPGTHVDSVAYLAQFILLWAPLSLLWGRLQWGEWLWALGLLVVVILGLAAFSPGVTSLYVDHLLSAWFLGSLLLYLNLREAGVWRAGLAFLPLLVLALIKEVGLALVMAAAVAMALEAFWRSGRKGVVRAALVAAALLLPALVATVSWKAQRDAWGVEHSRSSVAGVVGALFGQGLDTDRQLVAEIDRRFVEVALSQQLGKSALSWEYNAFSYPMRGLYLEPHRLSGVGFVAVWVGCWLIVMLALIPTQRRGDMAWLGMSVLVTVFGYVFMLWVNYRSTLGEYGLELSSILRYLHVLVLPMFLLLFWTLTPSFLRVGTLMPDVSDAGRAYRPYGSAAFVILLSIYAWIEPPYLRPLFTPVGDFPMRDATEGVASRVRTHAGSGSVWVFLPNDQPNEFLGRFLQFQLSPVHAHVERSLEFWKSDLVTLSNTLSHYAVLWFPTEGYQLDAAAEIVGTDSPSGIYLRQENGRFSPLVEEPPHEQ